MAFHPRMLLATIKQNQEEVFYDETPFQERFSCQSDSPLSGAWPNRAGLVGMEWEDEHHDHGVALDHGVQPIVDRMFDFKRQSQLQHDSPERRMCNQSADQRAD